MPVNPFDEFKAIYKDNSVCATFLVWNCGRNWGATVTEVWKASPPKTDVVEAPDIPHGYKIEWRGMSDKHVVVRESDGAIIVRGKKQRSEAVIALIEHVQNR